jgi:hypothetical protein
VGSALIRAGKTEGKTDRQKSGQVDMTKLIGAGRDYAQTPQNSAFFNTQCIYVIVWISVQTAIISLHNIN